MESWGLFSFELGKPSKIYTNLLDDLLKMKT